MESIRGIDMTKIAGREINKNTVVGVSVGTLLTIVVVVWTALGIGRPLFASDLVRIEEKIDAYQTSTAEKIDDYQTSTAVQILYIRKEALQSELREAKRDLRRNGEDEDAADDVDQIESDIDDLDTKIACHRTVGCNVGADL